jgi:hypothetical protein
MTRRGIPFSKLNGSGNDFLLIDARGGVLEGIDRPAFAARVCDRSRSVGADAYVIGRRAPPIPVGLLTTRRSRAEMSGNGGRCAAGSPPPGRSPGGDVVRVAGGTSASVSGRASSCNDAPLRLPSDRTLSLGGNASSILPRHGGAPPVLFVPASPARRGEIGAASGGTRRCPPGTNVVFAQGGTENCWCAPTSRVEGRRCVLHGPWPPPPRRRAGDRLAAGSVRTSGGEVLRVHFERGGRVRGRVPRDSSWSSTAAVRGAYRN